MANIRDAIRQLAQLDGETVALVCVVDEIDKAKRTVDCTPINEGAPLLGVNLQANQGSDFGVVIYPEKGAFVVVGFVADGAAGVVLTTDKIESAEIVIGETSAVIDADGLRVDTSKMSAHINGEDIVFNEGKLDGLVIIQKLTDKLNELKDSVNDLISKYNSHTHTTTATIGASPTVGVISPTTSSASPAKPFKKDDYENTKIKQ